MLEIYAGDSALKTIQEKGFSAELFSSFLGASGGPKWFTLYGLDKYIFGEFFNNHQQHLNLIGSSVGAFRTACFTQKDPVAAINRLATHYCYTKYTHKAKPQDISTEAMAMMAAIFGDSGEDEIVSNRYFKAHFIVAKCKGLVASDNKLLQGMGLLKSYVNNRISRRLLKSQYERYIFQSINSDLQLHDPYNISTTRQHVSKENIRNVLLASGSIPMVMAGMKDIVNSPLGMYRDGGIVDYHFDFQIQNAGLTLYPHFSSTLRAGWFDKSLSRKVTLAHYDRIVIVCPSQKFIQALPHHKIPDRTDFVTMQRKQRITYWQQVMAESEKLAEQFNDFYQKQNISSIKKISQLLTS